MLESIAAIIAALIAWSTPFVAAAPSIFVKTVVRETPREATILFGGDMMFDRAIRIAMTEKGDDHVFSCMTETLQDADMVVANLEGPITTHESVSVHSIPGEGDNFTFTFPTSTATLLKRHNIALVNLGNNHIMNFGHEGLVQTKQWLDEAGVAYFGDLDSLEADRVARPTINGVPFSLVNWSDWTPLDSFASNPSTTQAATGHSGAGFLNTVVEQVRKEAESGRVVVVYTHWGEEYVEPSPQMRQLAHSFVDAGAAIVIGSHPHIVQERESYNGRFIYYSLGNLVFDQYFDEAVRNGLLVRVTFDKVGVVQVEEIPVYLERDRRTCLKKVE